MTDTYKHGYDVGYGYKHGYDDGYQHGFAAGVHSVTAPGGRAKSAKKSISSAANGKLGGRPKGSRDAKPRQPRT